MVAAANDKMLNGMTVTLDGLQYAADSVNKVGITKTALFTLSCLV